MRSTLPVSIASLRGLLAPVTPLVCAFFIDLVIALLIPFLLNLL